MGEKLWYLLELHTLTVIKFKSRHGVDIASGDLKVNVVNCNTQVARVGYPQRPSTSAP